MFDPYSFCLIVLGLLFHLLWGTEDVDNWIFGFLVALGVELILEIIGNSQFVLKRIRDNSGTSGEYIGKLPNPTTTFTFNGKLPNPTTTFRFIGKLPDVLKVV